MKALIIGYGSIGRRHDEVLSSIELVNCIDLVTKQNIVGKKCFKKLVEVADIESYDYFVIASETSKHYEQLAYLEEHVSNRLILCEKPLFHQQFECDFNKNHIFLGYVMRYHPIIQRLKNIFQKNKNLPIFANIYCGQYLPSWRPNQDYRQSYSAKKSLGGGVLKDLSHEIDYAQFLFGDITNLTIQKRKVSDLEIDTDDCSSILACSSQGTEMVIVLDYLSRIPMRQLIIHSNKASYVADLVNFELQVKTHNQPLERICFEKLDRNELYRQMHLDLLTGTQASSCTLLEGLSSNEVVSCDEYNQ